MQHSLFDCNGSLFDLAEDESYVRLKFQAYIVKHTPAQPERTSFWWTGRVGLEGLTDRRPESDPTMRPGRQPRNGGLSPRGKAQAKRDDVASRCDRAERESAELRRCVGALYAHLDAVADRLDTTEDAVADLLTGNVEVAA